MNYSEFISEVLKVVNDKPSKTDMEFAYLVGHHTLGMNPAEAIELSTSL